MKRLLWSCLVTLLCAMGALLLWDALNSDPHEARWQDYLERLSRITAQPIPERRPLPLAPYPSGRNLKHELPKHHIDLLDYIELRHCDLMGLVSERNSALGKLQADSLRLQYEQRFVRLAQTCLDSGTLNNPALVRLLEQVIQEKRAALPRLRWNALAAGPELRHFLSLSPSARPGHSSSALSGLALLVSTLFDGQSPQTEPTEDLEGPLEQLAHSQAGGLLLRRQGLALHNLLRANNILAAVDPAALCPRNRASPRARRLRNVLDNIWGPKVQRELALAQRQRGQLAESLETLAGQSVATEDFRRWQDHYFGKAGLESQLQRALQEHIRLWQSRLRPCGLMPGQPPNAR